MAQKAVVTGGGGFVGSHIVDALLAKGFDTHVIDTFVAGRFEERINPSATYHEIDIRDYEKIAPILKGVQYVFHEAALPRVQFSIENPIETFAVNVDGLVATLKAAHEGGVQKFVFASSGSVYGDQETMPLNEAMDVQPKSPYGLQKRIGELTCRVWSDIYGLPTVCLRYFNVYGARMDPNGPYALAVGKFIKQRMEGKPITIWGDGLHSRDYTHVRDIVRANLLAAESPSVGKGEIMNIGAGKNRTVNELAAIIGGPTIYEPERLEPAHALADNQKARQLIGWEPTIMLEEGVVELKKAVGLT